ncbi:MAG: hypothetical protein KBA75_01120 [Alphaproteobacteria bacterium]|nr:hypothetical protein [Alphaproteobacteria bacterium]
MADVTRPEAEQALAARRLRARNWALFGLLFGFVVAIYLITIIKMGH